MSNKWKDRFISAFKRNPKAIIGIMGHRDTDMIIRVYSKYIENAGRHEDGANFDGMYKRMMSKEK